MKQMPVDAALYMRFPCVFRDKLVNNELKFPQNTRFVYDKILTYRAVERKKDDVSPITREDFRSYFELGKKPKPRGVSKDILSDPTYYGVSSFLNQRRVEQLMKFPNPNKKMASGYVYDEAGPEYTKEDHVCWWLFEDADVSGFRLIEEKSDG